MAYSDDPEAGDPITTLGIIIRLASTVRETLPEGTPPTDLARISYSILVDELRALRRSQQMHYLSKGAFGDDL